MPVTLSAWEALYPGIPHTYHNGDFLPCFHLRLHQLGEGVGPWGSIVSACNTGHAPHWGLVQPQTARAVGGRAERVDSCLPGLREVKCGYRRIGRWLLHLPLAKHCMSTSSVTSKMLKRELTTWLILQRISRWCMTTIVFISWWIKLLNHSHTHSKII